ncbi:unnamed protein product, partial [Amoebophrya sp. A25]
VFYRPGFCSKHFPVNHRMFDPTRNKLHLFLLGVSRKPSCGGVRKGMGLLAGVTEVVQLIFSFVGEFQCDVPGKRAHNNRGQLTNKSIMFSMPKDLAPASLDHKDYTVCEDCGATHCN